MVSAILLRELYGYDSIDEYQPTKYERTVAKDLFDEFLSYVNGQLNPGEVKRIAYEIGMLGTKGIDPDKSGYTIDAIIGKEFSGYEILAYYYVSWAQVFPSQLKAQDLPFTKAYELALQMFAGEKNR